MLATKWINPTQPERGDCRIRRSPNGLAEIGWEIICWDQTEMAMVRNKITKETMNLPRKQIEVIA